LDGPLPKLCLAVVLSFQDGRHSAVVLLLKAALIQVSDYRLLGVSGYKSKCSNFNCSYMTMSRLTYILGISNSSHFEWRAGLSDTILKGDHPRTIPAKFALIWFRGEDLNVIIYQNMSNLYNRYKSVERKISQKNPEYMLIYSLSCSCS
jgi:hypothetical protein